MFDYVRNYLGLKTPTKRTTFKTLRNSLLIVLGAGAFILTPTFLVHVDQANQLLQMQTTIKEGFQTIDDTAEKLANNSNPEQIQEQAEKRLGLTTNEVEQITRPTFDESSPDDDETLNVNVTPEE
jgi:hypothetical protein